MLTKVCNETDEFKKLNNNKTIEVIYWLIDIWIGWPINWLTDKLIDRLVDRLIDQLIDRWIDWSIDR